MGKNSNPFILKGYVSKELFCNREKEVQQLYLNVTNGINTTLISPRRMGKTGLIFRFFDSVTEHNTIETIYLDILSSRTLNDFIKLFAEAILHKFPEKTDIGQRFIQFIKGFRPTISWDTLTGQPQISLTYQNLQEKEHTLFGLLNFLEEQGKLIIIAIDEFQQIINYPEKNMEALLRSHIQTLQNVNFIFCGSQNSLMLNLFSNVKRPFYQSTQYISLEKIDRSDYLNFINAKFQENGIFVEDDALELIMDWSQGYTFYTQSLCNLLFYTVEDKATVDTVKAVCLELLKRNEPVFFQYRNMLTFAQWNFLIAIAKEREVKQLTAQNFIAKYEIGTPANARRISKSLLDKELLLQISGKKETSYRVYDLFFGYWLAHEY
jgi:uncharacterized protein